MYKKYTDNIHTNRERERVVVIFQIFIYSYMHGIRIVHNEIYFLV